MPSTTRQRRGRAFTLIEVLVSIAIIAMLIAVLVPALTQTRQQARRALCLSNLRQIGVGLVMYLHDNRDEMPWVNPAASDSWKTEFGWGGFIPPKPTESDGNSDFVKIPVEDRPLNKYISPDATGRDLIPIYICQSDSMPVTASAAAVSMPTGDAAQHFWETTGNSFAMNWWWMNFYDADGEWTFGQMRSYSPTLLRRKLGGEGSSFVVVYEAQLHTLLVDARAGGGGVQARGWHGQWSQHSALFLDGHCENRYMDTRYPFGDGWTIWPAPD